MAAFTHMADASSFIEQARALGVRIALDDFGAGASSFGYLKALKVDLLKIDGQFIQGLIDDPLDDVAVRCFDSPAILQRVRDLGVDHAQGYLLHRPEPLADLLDALAPAAAITVAPGTPAP